VAPRCPSCQQPISKDKIVNDKDLQREIQNFEVYCANKEKGCPWEGTLKDFQVHLDTCGFILIDCTNNCGARFERRFMSKHQSEDCAKRTITCEFCMKEKHLFLYSIRKSILFFQVQQILSSKMKFLI
jgi:TNF receptor-associated factor 4